MCDPYADALEAYDNLIGYLRLPVSTSRYPVDSADKFKFEASVLINKLAEATRLLNEDGYRIPNSAALRKMNAIIQRSFYSRYAEGLDEERQELLRAVIGAREAMVTDHEQRRNPPVKKKAVLESVKQQEPDSEAKEKKPWGYWHVVTNVVYVVAIIAAGLFSFKRFDDLLGITHANIERNVTYAGLHITIPIAVMGVVGLVVNRLTHKK